MRLEFSAFGAHLITPDGRIIPSSSPESPPVTEPSSRSSTPERNPRKKIMQTFVPTKVFIPADINSYSRIAVPTESPIGFLIPGRGVRGIPLKDIIDGDAVERMAFRDMFLFHRVEYGEVDLYLSWPGYVGHERSTRIDLYENGERMPLKVLAGAVAKFVFEYLESCKSLRCLDQYAKWRIADDGVKPEDVAIVSLVNIYEDFWQPELAIERDK